MNSEVAVEEFRAESYDKYVLRCKKCQGSDSECECSERHELAVEAFEAGVPQLFWRTSAKDVKHNRDTFKSIVVPYTQRLRKARRHGYGILFIGDNGVGKTMFLSFMLMEALRKGFSAYYTTMPQLDTDIKSGWRRPEVDERLQWLLGSDFLAIDELGKERSKTSAPDHYTSTQIERIFKSRCDNNMPLLLGTNMGTKELDEIYGSTITSMLSGVFQVAKLAEGDYRKNLHRKMVNEMGYRA
jgi:DNA replication protein DnaC